jgi:hypothetical protein
MVKHAHFSGQQPGVYLQPGGALRGIHCPFFVRGSSSCSLRLANQTAYDRDWRRHLKRLFGPVFLQTKRRHAAIYATADDVRDVLCRPWISRLWTYQEILLVSHPIIVCGDSHVPLARFEISIRFLRIAARGLYSNAAPWDRIAVSRKRLLARSSTSSVPNVPSVPSYTWFIKCVMYLHR